MRRVTTKERRARIGARHALALGVVDPILATRSLTALHSSDPATVYLSIWARVPGFRPPDLQRILYEDRSLVRFFGMRRTLWVIARDLVPVVHHSSTMRIGASEARRTIKLLEDGDVADDGAKWLADVVPKTLGVIEDEGEILTRELSKRLEELDAKLEFRNRAGRLMGSTGVASRVLTQLALESKVIRGRPAGTWVSGQYRWSVTDAWLGGPIPTMTAEEASARLLRAWLWTFGPARETDIKWWTGWPLRQVRTALADVDAIEVSLDGGGTGYLLPDDLDVVDSSDWVALLPSLDPTTMGWKERDWYLADRGPLLFDRNGNAGPTIWSNGRVVGGWAQRKDGEIAHELFDDIGSEATRSVLDRIADLRAWLGETVVTPRFRSPHDKGLAT